MASRLPGPDLLTTGRVCLAAATDAAVSEWRRTRHRVIMRVVFEGQGQISFHLAGSPPFASLPASSLVSFVVSVP